MLAKEFLKAIVRSLGYQVHFQGFGRMARRMRSANGTISQVYHKWLSCRSWLTLKLKEQRNDIQKNFQWGAGSGTLLCILAINVDGNVSGNWTKGGHNR